jgi:threonine/homoserine/homoserine lactone efflux protein
MIQIETILDILWKGFIIGVIVSAPLGPVGVLCIQRTLNKGRWYGFVTGIGASLSDIAYALLTGYGMSFVSIMSTRISSICNCSGVSCC